MSVTTDAIVLSLQPHSDKAHVLHAYTRAGGRVNYMVYGLGRKHPIGMYMPFSLIQITASNDPLKPPTVKEVCQRSGLSAKRSNSVSGLTSIIDTPGIKGFGTIDFKREEVSHYFPEIFRIGRNCRYDNCTHTNEPHCAVQEALEKGEIAISRYESYWSMLGDCDEAKYR
jgi:hypothetical protein